MKKILVPTDFSTCANKALQLAVEIAEASNGQIHLMHVVDLPILNDTFFSPTLYVEETLVRTTMDNVKKSFDKTVAKYRGMSITTSVEYGNPSMAILKLIEEQKADLVVMGTQGASGLKEILVGSNTEKIVRGSRVPVISVPQATKLGAIKKIVFPNSLLEKSEKLTLAVKALQHFFKAELHLVYVNTPSNFKRDYETQGRLRTYVRRYMLKNTFTHIFNDISEQEGTMNFATEIGANLIAMGTHGRKGLGHLFAGSVAEDVVNHVNCPIWTMRVEE